MRGYGAGMTIGTPPNIVMAETASIAHLVDIEPAQLGSYGATVLIVS